MMENYDPIILVTRGDELPKKNFEKKLHPTYETSIRIANSNHKHLVVKFFDQYRALHDALLKMGIGKDQSFSIEAEFPPTLLTSSLGLGMSEDQLQQRCYLLNKWMQNIFNNYHLFPEKAQDKDESREKNKNHILDLIKKKNEIKLPELIHNYQEPNREPQPVAEDEKPLELTPEVLLEYSKHQIVNDYLQVGVTRHYVDSKNRYETNVHMLTFDELQIPKTEIDATAYNNVTLQMTELNFMRVFDPYRQLKYALAEVGVFGKDKKEKAAQFNEDKSQPYLAVVLDAEFPKTYPKSTFGIGLNEPQLKTREALLNKWLITVLRTYKTLNPNAQRMIREFLEINDESPLHQTYIAILNGTYEPPKSEVKSDAEKAKENKGRRTSILGMLSGGGSNNNRESNNSPVNSPGQQRTMSQNYSMIAVSGSNKGDQSLHLDGNDDLISEIRPTITPVDLSPPSANQLVELSRETVINDFLVVSVTKGDMLAKKKDETKKHHGYLTTLRIRYYEEIDGREDLIKIDQAAYNQISMLPAKTILKVFDGYRALKTSLEEYEVYSMDKEKIAREKPSSILIAAYFPKTYTRSALGLGLGESEIRTRTAELNYWMGKLLQQYCELPSDAQDLVNQFLSIDDSPAEQENVVLSQILQKKFIPPYIDPNKNKKKNAKNNKSSGGGGAGGSAGTKGSNNNSNRNSNSHQQHHDDGSDDDEHEGSVEGGGNDGRRSGNQQKPVSQGCACVIM